MIIALLSFLGLVLGYILASKVEEELNQGKKWFNILAILILVFLLIELFLSAKFNFSFLIALVIGGIINYFIKKTYLFLGIIAVLASFIDKNIILLLSLLIFIFGLAYGTLNYIKFKKININNVLINFILFILPFILLLFKDFALNYRDILAGSATGGIIIAILQLSSGFKKEKRTSRHR